MHKIIIMSILLMFPLISFAQWDDCPHGETDNSCEAPGKCGRYIDTNVDSVCDHSQTKSDNVTNKVTKIDNDLEQSVIAEAKPQKTHYPLFGIAAITSLLYCVTYILAQNKVIAMITHKKIWNSILTISFVATAGLSVILIMRINSGYELTLPFDVLYWHVVTGIVMMVVVLFHMGWHWRYYKNLFKK